ncbi:MAG: 2-dehydropantoate 2-reductase [Bacteroidota bacterium]
MRIAILGTGGAGGYFGAQLARGGLDVVFIARGEHLKAIRSNGLHVETTKGEIIIQPAQVTDDPRVVGIVDAVIVGVKSWQVSGVAALIQPMLGSDTCVVPLQNGVEASSQLAAVLGARHVLSGVCLTISMVASPGRIRSLGETHLMKIGEMDNRPSTRVKRLQRAFEHAGVKVDVPLDINVALWEKFLLVVSFGGVGSVTRAPIGVIRTVPETRRMLEQCMSEILAVANARGISLSDGVVEKSMAFLDSLPEGGTTSLQRDLSNGRPSELEALNGAVVRLGGESRVDVPLNTFIYHALLAHELKARGQKEFPT